MGLVGLAHCISHFSQLLLPPLFLWLKQDFNASYTELGVLLTIFFVVSCAVQALSGFVVDRFGPRPVLFAGIGLLALAAFGYAVSTSYSCWRSSRSWPASATASSIRSTTPCSTARSIRSGWAMRSASTASPAASAGRWRRR